MSCMFCAVFHTLIRHPVKAMLWDGDLDDSGSGFTP